MHTGKKRAIIYVIASISPEHFLTSHLYIIIIDRSTLPLPLSPAYCLHFQNQQHLRRAQHPCVCVHTESCTAISCPAKSRQSIRHLHAVQNLSLISMWILYLFSFLYESPFKMPVEYCISIFLHDYSLPLLVSWVLKQVITQSLGLIKCDFQSFPQQSHFLHH